MKKLFMIAALAVSTLAASAQVYLGGSLGFESVKPVKGADASSTFSFKPEVGYNFDESWAVGVQLGFTTTNANEYGAKTDDNVNVFSIAPYVRYTFAKTGIASFFVDGGFGFDIYGGDADGNVFGIGVRPGVSFAISEKVSVVSKLGYLGYKKYNDDLGGGSAFGLNTDNNTNLELGVFYNF
jgi:hypothetical protein